MNFCFLTFIAVCKADPTKLYWIRNLKKQFLRVTMPSTKAFYYILMSLLTLVVTKTTVDAMTVKNHISRSAESENLTIILNYIQRMQKSYPSILSLVSSDGRSSLVDILSKYAAKESIVSYKSTMNNLSRIYMWQNRIDLTWIFIIDDINIWNTFVHEQSHIWKANSRYLIIVTTRRETISARIIFQTIWLTYGVYKIVIISMEDDFRCLNGYLPFKKNSRNKYGVAYKICSNQLDQQDNIELYANFENLNGYPIPVVVFPSVTMKVTFDEDAKNLKFNGLDANVMMLLEQAMGARFHINVLGNRNSTKGKYQDPFDRTLQYIENGKAEIIANGFFVHQYNKYRGYEFTVSIYEDKLCLLAPTADFVPKSYMPIMSFAPDLWMALAIYNVLVSVLWFLVRYYSLSFRRREGVLLPLMRIAGSTFVIPQRSNLSSRIHPYVSSCFDLVETWCYPLKEKGGSAGSTAAQRALLIGTLFFGLIITGLYQSCLVSNLSNPFRYPELDTLEDVASSNLTIITKYYNLKENTFMGNTSLDEKLRSKTQIISKNRTYDVVAFGRRAIAITRYSSIKLIDMSKYYDADGNELLHIVEEYPTIYLLSFVMRIHSPYRERINELLLRIREAGLIHLWYERMTYLSHVAEQKRKMDKSNRKIKLTVEHYSLTFVGLLIGLFFCTIVFFAELYFARISSSQSQ